MPAKVNANLFACFVAGRSTNRPHDLHPPCHWVCHQRVQGTLGFWHQHRLGHKDNKELALQDPQRTKNSGLQLQIQQLQPISPQINRTGTVRRQPLLIFLALLPQHPGTHRCHPPQKLHRNHSLPQRQHLCHHLPGWPWTFLLELHKGRLLCCDWVPEGIRPEELPDSWGYWGSRWGWTYGGHPPQHKVRLHRQSQLTATRQDQTINPR